MSPPHPSCIPSLTNPANPQGCSLYKACNATTPENVGSDPTLCDPFQQLATICAHDTGMGSMSGCRAHFNPMCANGSVVPQCKREPGFDLMTTEDANKWVSSSFIEHANRCKKLTACSGATIGGTVIRLIVILILVIWALQGPSVVIPIVLSEQR